VSYRITIPLTLGPAKADLTLKVIRVDRATPVTDPPTEVELTPIWVYTPAGSGSYHVEIDLPDRFRGPVVFLNDADDAFLTMVGIDPYEIEGVRLHHDAFELVMIEDGVNAREALALIGAGVVGENVPDGDELTYYAMAHPGTPRVVGDVTVAGIRSNVVYTMPALIVP
jgi:hypothetical protein